MLYSNDGIYTVGLTGMSGAGKTTACRIFAENGFSVTDCDAVAREVAEKGKPALELIAKRFGEEMLNSDGTLDRRRLGEMVFSDSSALKALNDIIYPFITYNIIEKIYSRRGANAPRLELIDAPTLFESGADRLCDAIVCVTADVGSCTERIMRRDGIDRVLAEKRLSSQHDADYYRERCGYCAENCGSHEEFSEKVREIAVSLKNDAAAAVRRV